ncbi:MAG TPA: NUDIX hydrolase [Candidatus Sumerlaeota bacterium]|nr:NUDIX hydrolase [Candidatus Sumerlaeota bacterium]HOR28471.1 NUDIX hydrolase [Candidatus Sumerlaeota bacterium]
MHRAPLLTRLRRHVPSDAVEAEHLQRMIEFVERENECFERSLARGHLTGSAFIIDEGRTHALLLHHAKLERWLQPGGHADGEQDLHAVALREAREETGLASIQPLGEAIFDVDVHAIPARAGTPAHWHYDVRYLFEADQSAPLRGNRESKGLAWRELGVIGMSGEESLARMARKVLARFGERFVAG